MKKIFTLGIAAIATFSLAAGNVTLLHNGTALEDGASYSTGYTEDEISATWDAELSLVTTPGTEVTVEVTTDDFNALQFCGLNGECVVTGPDDKVVKTATIDTDSPVALEIDYIAYMGVGMLEEDVVFTVKAYATSTPEEAVTVTVTFTPEEAGLTTIEAQQNGAVEYFDLQGRQVVNPASGQMVIRRQGSQSTTILVR